MGKKIGFIVIVGFLLKACASVEVGGYLVPGEVLDTKGHYHILVPERDERGLSSIIKKELLARGFNVTDNTKENTPNDVDYIIEYGGQWQWDITWYLLNFDFRIYHPETRLLIASAHTLRTSLVRKTPDDVVTETLNQIFK